MISKFWSKKLNKLLLNRIIHYKKLFRKKKLHYLTMNKKSQAKMNFIL